MTPAHLVHRHLPVRELRTFNVLAQFADHQFAAQPILMAETSRVDSLKAGEKLARLLQVGLEELCRIVAQTIVVTFVPQRGCPLRIGTQLVFPLFVRQGEKLLPACFNAGRRGHWVLSKRRLKEYRPQTADYKGIAYK